MRRTLAAVVVLAIVGACQPSASPTPSAAGPSRSPSTGQASASPASSAPASATPSGAPSNGATGGRWELAGTPNMNAFNTYTFAIVPIAGGRVLLLSEDVDEPYGPTAQVWDLRTNAWHDVEPLAKHRSSYVAVSLADGRALVTGGVNDDRQSFSSTFLFDPATETWTKSGLLGTARTNATAAVLKDGRVLVAGGYYQNGKGPGDAMGDGAKLAAFHPDLADIDVPVFANALATAELFDPRTGTWSPTGSMVYARNGAVATTLSDGRVLVFGSEAPWNSGVAVDARTFESAEIYDPASGTFSMAGSLPPIDRDGLEAAGPPGANPVPEETPNPGVGEFAVTPDGGTFLFGVGQDWKHVGDITRSFSYRDGTWTELPGTWVMIGEPTANVLYLAGVPDMNGATASVLAGGRILLAGGNTPTTPGQDEGVTVYDSQKTAAARTFDPATSAWSDAPAMPGPRINGQAITLDDGTVIVLGGDLQIDEATSTPPAVRFIP